MAKTIQANFAVNIGLLTGLPVGTDAPKDEKKDAKEAQMDACEHRRHLLVAISLWKVARFLKDLSDGYRLRSECDLGLGSVSYRAKWNGGTGTSFPYERIISDATEKAGDQPADASLQDLIAKAKLPANRSPLILEFGD